MAQKQTKHIFTGLNRDLAPDKIDTKHYCDAKNVRVNVSDDGSLLSITNEKGTDAVFKNIIGKCIGKAVIGKYLILFTHELNKDHIWRIDTENYRDSIDLYGKGSLGFTDDNYIDTVVSYESDKIQKVYWCDGINQNRMINIVAPHEKYDNNSFDFIKIVNDTMRLDIERIIGASSFVAGTIQYFITYYNKNGQESNIVCTSPLLYISEENKGSAPGISINNIFKLYISNISQKWDYIRVYSLQRTSKDTEPIARVVNDIPTSAVYNEIYNGTSIQGITNISPDDKHWFIPIGEPVGVLQYDGEINDEIEIRTSSKRGIVLYDGTPLFIKTTSTVNVFDMYHKDTNITLYEKRSDIIFTDNGIGETINSTELFMIGGVAFSSETMDAKDNVLFLGNIKLQTSVIPKDVVHTFHKADTTWLERLLPGGGRGPNFYDYDNQLKYSDITGYKAKETYRFGLQFKDKYGIWSEPIWVKDSKNPNYPKLVNGSVHTSIFTMNMNQPDVKIALNKLRALGYTKVRPVAVMPKEYEREVVCQGVLNPTVYNVKDRTENGPYMQPSWFYRPILPVDMNDNLSVSTDLTKGSWLSYRHGEGIYGLKSRSSEIAYGVQGPNGQKYHPSIYMYREDINQFVVKQSELYYVDANFVTLDSPDISFDDNINIDNTSLRVCGLINMAAFVSDIDMDVSRSNTPYGFYHYKVQVKNKSNNYGCNASTTGAFYSDFLETEASDDPLFNPIMGFKYDNTINLGAIAYAIYAWNRSGNINAFGTPYDAKLISKTMSNLRYSDSTTYLDDPVLFQQVSLKVHQGDAQSKSILLDDKYYYVPDKLLSHDCDHIVSNCVDIILGNTQTHYYVNSNITNGTPSQPWFPIEKAGDINYFKVTIPIGTIATDINLLKLMNGITPTDVNKGLYASTGVTAKNKRNALIPINYASSKHAIINLHSEILPSVNNRGKGYLNTDNIKCPFFDKSNPILTQSNITVPNQNNGVLLMGELYRNVLNKFGGTSDFALQHNDWIVAGKDSSILNNNIPFIEWTQGDTYYQRYDHLKTYAYNENSVNNIVEILSFMVETRINIDGRYDERGKESNLYMNNTNFNLINKAYTQLNDFVKSKILDERFDSDTFSSSVTYTKTKVPNAVLDAWTNTTLVNMIDLDGNKGNLVKLLNYNDNILALQEHGIAEIIFNPNVQISSSNGLPIEIANSGKVQGKRYLFDNIGVQSKKAVANTRSGLWWIDNYSHTLFQFNNGLNDVTTKLGMKSWLKKHIALRLDYDNVNGNLYLTDSTDCLGYSETLGQFESFYSFNDSDIMAVVKNKFYSLKDGTLWEHGVGEYNTFYDKLQPSFIEFIHNENPDINKIYHTLNYRASFDDDSTFNYLKVSNEYQETNDKLPIDAVRKFRVWRCQIPRDKNNRFDRIQNTWSKIKIGYIPTNATVSGFKLYDVVVCYEI